MKDFPIYAPIKKTFSFDKSKMIDEIDKFLLPFVEERTLPFKNGRSIYDQDGLLNIASDEDLQNTSKYYLDENEIRVPVSGKFKTYRVINLTHLLEEEDSLIDIYKTTDAKKKIFWHTYKKAFKWRDTLENSYIKQVVEQFPWEYVQGVRLIYMSPPSIGQIHRDSNPLDNYKYFREGFASISFNIESGGGTLNFIDKDNTQKTVDSNVKIYHFNDSAPHGVTAISSARYQLRVWGKLSVPYKEILE
jgi:hypothetical protein